MFKRKEMAPSLGAPNSEPLTDAADRLWDPIGSTEAPATDRLDPNQPPDSTDDPELQDFLAAIASAKDADSEFFIVSDETAP